MARWPALAAAAGSPRSAAESPQPPTHSLRPPVAPRHPTLPLSAADRLSPLVRSFPCVVASGGDSYRAPRGEVSFASSPSSCLVVTLRPFYREARSASTSASATAS